MRKIYSLFLLLFMLLSVSHVTAQVYVQGHPHPTAKPQVVSLRAIADESFTMDDILNWSGEGENQAALVVQWNVNGEENALVWGYRWTGKASGEMMIQAVASTDPRFYYMVLTGTGYGTAIGGLGYDVDQSGDFAIEKEGKVSYPNEKNCFPITGYYPFDGYTSVQQDDYWQSGWYKGYWSYWLKSSDKASWTYSGLGATSRQLTNGCWDGWKFSVNMNNNIPWKPMKAAPANGPAVPSIKVQPGDIVVSPGEPVSFNPEFRGDSLTYQWYKDEAVIQGADTSFYYIASATTEDAGRYYCVVKNMLDTISTDTVTLTVGEKTVTYKVNEGTETVTISADDQYKTYSGALKIPASVQVASKDYAVTGIDSAAFAGSEKLTAITLPESLVTIGGSAFNGCIGLVSVSVEGTIKSVGKSAFENCVSLEKITLNGVESVDSKSFKGCVKLAEVDFGDNIAELGDSVFLGCSVLKAIKLPGTVQKIGDRVFQGCSVLETVKLGNGMDSIGVAAFNACLALKEIALPNSLIAIKEYAFSGCSALGKVTFKAADTPVTKSAEVSASKLRTIGARAFESTKITTLDIPEGVETIGIYAFSEASLQSIKLPESLMSLGNFAFNKCESLTTVTFGANLTEIGTSTFQNCLALTSVTCPSVTKIGEKAFYNCTSLKELPFTEKTTTIGKSAFEGCSAIETLELPDNITSWDQAAFKGCSGLVSAKIGQGVTSLPYAVFRQCTKLEKVDITENITEIETTAFTDCESLKAIPITSSVTTIGGTAFSGCTSLTSVHLSDNVTSIGTFVFKGCSALEEVVLGKGITVLSQSMLRDNSNLKKLVVDGMITAINRDALNGCSSLERIYINTESVLNISSNVITNVPETCKIFVPAALVEDYKEASNWQKFIILPRLSKLGIEVTSPSMDFGSGNYTEVDESAKTFKFTFNRDVEVDEIASVELRTGGSKMEGQEVTYEVEGNTLTATRAGRSLPEGEYEWVITAAENTLTAKFHVVDEIIPDVPAPLSIVSNTVSEDFNTFMIEFNRAILSEDNVSASLKRDGQSVEDQTLTVSYEGNVLTLEREGSDLTAGTYEIEIATSGATLSMTFEVGSTVGVENVEDMKPIRSKVYYSMDGTILSQPKVGINIVKITYEDNTVEIRKINVNPGSFRRW